MVFVVLLVFVLVLVFVHGLVKAGGGGAWVLGLDFVYKGRGNGELALSQQVHGYGAVDQRQMVPHTVPVRG
jgi:hypothetical protein